MKNSEKLYWLEYTDCGPLIITKPFEVVGFKVKDMGWHPDFPNVLMEDILPEIKTWRPSIIVFWMAKGYWEPFTGEEPNEWITACQIIREHPHLQHTKIMAFLGFEESAPEQEDVWRQRYDFYTTGPLKVIEHAKVAKQLVGEELKGFEGVNYYLLTRNGSWKIQGYLLNEQRDRDALQPDAEGQFARIPRTRLLTTDQQGSHAWIIDGVRTETLTYIVYIIKALQVWQEEELNAVEIKRLSTLAGMAQPGNQLLIGANDILLQTGPKTVGRVLEQAQQAGGWQVFINEHLWFENIPNPLFEEVVYEGVKYERWQYPIAM